MHKSLKSINTVIFEGILLLLLLKAHVVSFFSYLTSVPRTFDLDCRNTTPAKPCEGRFGYIWFVCDLKFQGWCF